MTVTKAEVGDGDDASAQHFLCPVWNLFHSPLCIVNKGWDGTVPGLLGHGDSYRVLLCLSALMQAALDASFTPFLGIEK